MAGSRQEGTNVVEVAGGGIVLAPGEARRIEIGDSTIIVHAAGDATTKAFSLLETVEAGEGSGPPLHVHRDAAESFYVLEGAYDMLLDGRGFRCEAGSFIYVPRGMPHTFRGVTAGSRKLNLYTPAAMVGYFDDLAAGIRTGLDEDGLSEIAARYSMDVVGPVPDSYL
jgi:mannose-6-phosphate isomerase-like protein (cupin superfamily)